MYRWVYNAYCCMHITGETVYFTLKLRVIKPHFKNNTIYFTNRLYEVLKPRNKWRMCIQTHRTDQKPYNYFSKLHKVLYKIPQYVHIHKFTTDKNDNMWPQINEIWSIFSICLYFHYILLNFSITMTDVILPTLYRALPPIIQTWSTCFSSSLLSNRWRAELKSEAR